MPTGVSREALLFDFPPRLPTRRVEPESWARGAMAIAIAPPRSPAPSNIAHPVALVVLHMPVIHLGFREADGGAVLSVVEVVR